MSYFPQVTLVKEAVKIRRERILPRPGEVTARIGQQVTAVHVVARAAQETGYQILRASEVLDVPPQELSKYLLVEEGAAIQRGMPLMRKRSGLGRSRRYASPIDGILFQVRRGSLILQQTPTLYELRAMMSGHIASIFSNRGVVVETDGSLVQGLWGSGGESFGRLQVVTATPEAALDADLMGGHSAGAILVGGRLADATVLRAADENGVRGIVVGSLRGDLVPMAQAVDFPVIVTDGIGQQAMAAPIFALLQGAADLEASLFSGRPGHEQRPEVIIPRPELVDAPALGDEAAALSPGQTVRLIGGPHASDVGHVRQIHPRPHATDAGTRAPGVSVELADGAVVFVPFANLDIIM